MSSEVISRSVAPAATGQSSRTASRMKLALDKADGMDILQEHMDRAWLGARPRGRTQPSDIGRVPTEQQEQARGDSYQHFFNRAATAPLEMSRAGGPAVRHDICGYRLATVQNQFVPSDPLPCLACMRSDEHTSEIKQLMNISY